MLLAAVFAFLVTGAGIGVLRLLRLPRGPLLLGLAPPSGLALLGVLLTWTGVLGVPHFVSAAAFLVVCAVGIGLAAQEWSGVRSAFASGEENRRAGALLLLSVLIPATVLGLSLAPVAAPVSSHDGAHHVEMVQTLRSGGGWIGWYPAGYHAILAVLLQLVPWVDTAEGAAQASLALTLLVQLGVFGLGYSILHRRLLAATAALVVSFTYHYPYSLHLWSLWPSGAGIVLVLGVWITAHGYLQRPRLAWVLLGALLVGGIVLIHGIELYTALVGLVLILLGLWRDAPWRRLALEVLLAFFLALVLAAPYLPTLLGWASAGGAVVAGAELEGAIETRTGVGGELALPLLLLDTFSGILVDVPIRAALLVAGSWWIVRQRRGRVLVALFAAFLAIALAFIFVDLPPVQRVFALTFPWSHGYRVLLIASMLAGMIGGVGLAAAVSALSVIGTAGRLLPKPAVRLAIRIAMLTVLVSLIGTVALLPQRLSVDAAKFRTYSVDDARAMGWLRQYAERGSIVANDGAADAGIWAPYKAGLPILLPRALPVDHREARALVRVQVAQLDQSPEAATAVCLLGVRYVYRGAKGTGYEDRRFPSLEVLRQSPALEEVFSSGDATVFRIRVPCADAP